MCFRLEFGAKVQLSKNNSDTDSTLVLGISVFETETFTPLKVYNGFPSIN